MQFKTGLRNVRPMTHLPHWSALKMKYAPWTQAVTSVDYLANLPNDLGMMGNDAVGDCFWAGQYHHRQLNTLIATGTIITEPDNIVLGAYSSATGFVPGDASTDRGTDPAEGFAWMMANGLPTNAGSPVKVLGCIEIDPRNIGDVLEAMQYCGGLLIGMSLPQSFIDAATPPLVWDWPAGDADSGDGHEVYLGRADITGQDFGIVSWGVKSYSLTSAMWARGVNQVTAVITEDWVESTGQTPFGMTAEQLVAEMNAHSGGPIP